MKSLLMIGVFLFSGLAFAQQKQLYKEGELVYDRITHTVKSIDYYKDGVVYLYNPDRPQPWYSLPRDEMDLVPRVKGYYTVKEGDHVSFYNDVLKRYDEEKVRYVFANGLAFLTLTVYQPVMTDYHFFYRVQDLGYEVPSIAGLDLKVGDKACPIKQTPRFRRPGSAGKVVKFFSNGTVLLMYKDFFLQTNYEAIPLDNLSVNCKK